MPEFTTDKILSTNVGLDAPHPDMTQAIVPSNVDVAMATLQTLINLASGVTAVIGGVSAPIAGGIAIAQALVPVVSKFIIQIGDEEIVMDVSKVTTGQVVAAMQKDIDSGFPVLSFRKPREAKIEF